jgi:hypothetical protein
LISQHLIRMGGCGGRGGGAGGRQNSALGGRSPHSAFLGRSPRMSLMPWSDLLMCPVCRLVHDAWPPCRRRGLRLGALVLPTSIYLQCQPNPSPWILLRNSGFCSDFQYESSFLTVIHPHKVMPAALWFGLRRQGPFVACSAGFPVESTHLETKDSVQICTTKAPFDSNSALPST